MGHQLFADADWSRVHNEEHVFAFYMNICISLIHPQGIYYQFRLTLNSQKVIFILDNFVQGLVRSGVRTLNLPAQQIGVLPTELTRQRLCLY